MSLDAMAEKTAIKTRALALCGGRVYPSVPEETQLERDPVSKLILPYIILTFGSLYPQEADRSIEGAEQQPQIMPIIAECWASNSDAAGATAGAFRTLFVGFHPDENNASEIELRGGGFFQQKDSSGRPVRFMESVTGQTTLNLSIDVP